MIQEDLKYSILGKTVSSRPVVIECQKDATVKGNIHLNRSSDVFSAYVYKTESPTGIAKYEAVGPDLYTGSVLGYTGYQSDIDFVFTPSAIAGSTAGNFYGVKFVAAYTGVFGTKSEADMIVEITNNLEA